MRVAGPIIRRAAFRAILAGAALALYGFTAAPFSYLYALGVCFGC